MDVLPNYRVTDDDTRVEMIYVDTHLQMKRYKNIVLEGVNFKNRYI